MGTGSAAVGMRHAGRRVDRDKKNGLPDRWIFVFLGRRLSHDIRRSLPAALPASRAIAPDARGGDIVVSYLPVPALRLEPPVRLVIRFGAERDVADDSLPVGLPVIAGEPCESLFPSAVPAGRAGDFALYQAGDWLLGHAQAQPGEELESATLRLYAGLVGASRGRHLCRIWNYVPGINACRDDGLENYQAFSRARSLAFERAMGAEFKRWLPSASAVGSNDGRFAVVFAANRATPQHRENPRQVPAYEYPLQYGPRAPSFARATIVPRADGRRDVFISGTSAITGHATIAPGDTPAQTRCTLANLREISRACDLGDDLGAGRSLTRHVKIYLRDAADQTNVAAEMDASLIRPGDVVSYLVADICRAALNVEVEVTLFGVA